MDSSITLEEVMKRKIYTSLLGNGVKLKRYKFPGNGKIPAEKIQLGDKIVNSI
jgi:hypothetical protein